MEKSNEENKIFDEMNKHVKEDLTKKNPPIFMFAVKLVAIAIILYVSLNHIGVVADAFVWLYEVLEPLLVGALLALILNTPMCSLKSGLDKLVVRFKLKISSKGTEIIALILTFVFAFLVLYIVGDTIIPQLYESIKSVFLTIQSNIPEFMKLLDKLESEGINTAPIEKWLNEIDINEIIKRLGDNFGNILNTLLSSATSIITGLFKAISAVVFAVYILANKKKLSRQIRKLSYAYIKKSVVDYAVEIGSMSSRTFSDFISGQCLDAIILGVMMFFSMSFFRFPYPLAVSTLIVVTALIPYIGAFVGGAFGALLMIMEDPLRAILFIVLFIVVQQIDNHLIYPRVVGGSVGLPAIWTFAAVIIGGGVFGVLGMVLFIPIFSVIYTIVSVNVQKRLKLRGIVIDDGDEEEQSTLEKKPRETNEFAKKFEAFFKKKKKTEAAEEKTEAATEKTTDKTEE